MNKLDKLIITYYNKLLNNKDKNFIFFILNFWNKISEIIVRITITPYGVLLILMYYLMMIGEPVGWVWFILFFISSYNVFYFEECRYNDREIIEKSDCNYNYIMRYRCRYSNKKKVKLRI